MESLSHLESGLSGTVIRPTDSTYEEARTLFYGGPDLRPAAIVRVAEASDVAKVVTFAASQGLELAVRSGGHSPARHSSVEGGLVLDLGAMRRLDIDPTERTAWAETGLTAVELTNAAGEHDLGVSLGDTGSVGIGGITQAGGVGFMVRKHGLTIDSVLAAEVVTADGQILSVDAESHPDLFWAIRGGGGNFGVVTRFKYRLHDVSQAFGGILILPATPETIAGYMAAAADAPENLSTMLNVMVAPPMPFIPPEHHGRLVALGIMVNVGDTAAGEGAAAPFRRLAEPLADMLQPMRYRDIYPPEDEEFHPVAYGHTMFMADVDEGAATTVIERVQTSTAMMSVVNLRALGGAHARVAADATAYAHRSSPIMANVAAIFGEAEELPTHRDWVEGVADQLDQGEDGAYVGFLGNEGPERVRAAYPGPTWDRLRQIKRRYDPDNLFRHNQNIPPS